MRPVVAIALLALAGTELYAASEDRNAIAEIYADRVQIDREQQLSRYQGRVEFRQGSIRFTGDQVLLRDGAEASQRMEVTGSPARYRELDDHDRPLRARADSIDYHRGNGTLKLRGDAVLCRAGEYFRSDTIEYNSATGAVQAGKQGASDGERVHITLRPGSDAPGDCDQMP